MKRCVGLTIALLIPGCAASSHQLATRSTPSATVVIDRFSAHAGHLQVRTKANHLPGPGQSIDFDHEPLITQSHGPGGEVIRYYNFDVQSTTPAIYYELVDGNGKPIVGQAPIVDAIPGEAGYSDFVERVLIRAPAGYVVNQVRDAATIRASGWPRTETGRVLNRPIVPPGSIARERLSGAPAVLEVGWYRGKHVSWLRFDETELSLTSDGKVPTSPIYVTFNRNPNVPGGGPPSGFVHEAAPNAIQTHNVASSVPGDLDYSPLWLVSVYDNASFATVINENTLLAATILAPNVATVNCPIVFVAPR